MLFYSEDYLLLSGNCSGDEKEIHFIIQFPTQSKIITLDKILYYITNYIALDKILHKIHDILSS